MPGRRKPTIEVSPLYGEIGMAIKKARQVQGLSQEDLARAVRLTRTSITNLEGGKQQVPLHTLYEIASAVGCEVRDLLPRSLPTRTAREYDEVDVERWAKQLERTSRRATA